MPLQDNAAPSGRPCPWQLASLFRTLVVMLLLLLSLTSNAAPPLTVSGPEPQTLNGHWQYRIDPTGSLTLKTLLTRGSEVQWSDFPQSGTPNLGLTDDPVWFRASLTTPIELNRLLSVDYPPLDHLSLYLVRGETPVYEQHTGDQRPFFTRPLDHRNFVFPLSFETGQSYTLFVRLQTEGALHLPATLWPAHAFIEQSQKSLSLQVLFVGIMAALAAYNLLLCFVVRDSAYVWYVVFLCAYLLAQVSLRGLGFQYLWPGYPLLNNINLTLFLSISLGAVGFFTNSFLDVRRYSAPWSLALRAIGWAGMVLALLSPLLPYKFLITLLIWSVTASAAVALCAACFLWWRGQPLARLYVVAWGLFLLGNALYNLSKSGLVPYSALSEYTVQIGTVLQMLLLSFALAQRINQERQRRQEAQEHAFRIQKEATEELESRVQERTEALNLAYEQLKTLSQTDGLTQLKNRQYFDQTLEQEWRRNSRESRQLSLMLLDVDHFKTINDTLGHPCGDACLRHLALLCQGCTHRASDMVARYGGEEFVILLPCTTLEGAAYVAETLRKAVAAERFEWDGQAVPLTISVGVSGCIPSPSMDVNSLVSQADEALYAAKNAGRNCTRIFHHEGEPDIRPAAELLS